MADINTDEHGLKLSDNLRKLHGKEVASHLTVHLPDNIRGLRMIEGVGIPAGDYLRGHPVLIKSQLVHGIIVLTTQERKHDQWVAELVIFNHVACKPSV